MKKKIWLGILSLVLVCSMLIHATAANAASTPDFKYKDWKFNDDYTKITIGGKTYDNYIVIAREMDSLYVKNAWCEYITIPDLQAAETPDQYAADIKGKVDGILGGMEFGYPKRELLTINWKAWQDTEFKDMYLKYFNMYYDSELSKAIDKNKLFSILADNNYNGYAQAVLKEGLTLQQAQEKYPVDKLPVQECKMQLYKSYQEFVSDGNSAESSSPGFDEFTFNSISEMKEKLKTDTPITGKNPVMQPKTSVILFLDKPSITISQGSDVKTMALDAAPTAPRGTTLVPIRAISEAFGAKVDWFGDTQEVLITKGTTTIKLKLGSDIAIVNGNQVKMLEAAQTINGRTVVPLRFISENMGYKVDWDGSTQKITITE